MAGVQPIKDDSDSKFNHFAGLTPEIIHSSENDVIQVFMVPPGDVIRVFVVPHGNANRL